MTGLVVLGYAFGAFAILAGLVFLVAAGGNCVIPCVPPPREPEDDA